MDSGQACQKGILPDVLPKARLGRKRLLAPMMRI